MEYDSENTYDHPLITYEGVDVTPEGKSYPGFPREPRYIVNKGVLSRV